MQTAEHAVREMKEIWGGNLPSWEDFKKALKDGRVRSNKTIAAQLIHMKGMPKADFIIWGVIVVWLGFLIFPTTLIAWFFMEFSAWWILGSLFVAWFLIKVSRQGHCQSMEHAAERDEKLYEMLVSSGAFLFRPDARD